MYTNIRSWVEAMIDWANDNHVNVNWFTNTHCEWILPKGRLYIDMSRPNWRISTIKGWSMEEDHIVVDETDEHQLRVRRGPIGKLKVVEYRPNFDDGQKLVSASCYIAKHMTGGIRESFMNTFVLDDDDDDEI